jgi:putative ABC transport system permease protein
VSVLRLLTLAVIALSRAKTRSLLTMLGVIIGVAAVIAMVSLGEGARAKVAATFSAMGTNTLVVTSGSTRTGGARGGAGTQPTITWDDLRAIRGLDEVARAVPQLRRTVQVQSDVANWQTSVTGTEPEWFDIRAWPIATGEAIDAADVAAARKVAVLGGTVAEELFGYGVDPIGATVRIDRTPFVVIGVAAAKGTSPGGQDNDDVVVIPATTYVTKVGGAGVAKYLPGQILVQAVSDEATSAAQASIEDLLRRLHRIEDGGVDDFAVRDLSAIAEAQQASTATITSLLAGVALVSLIVGGIGIMNIMLVSVTERTREIGLRMAVGAKPRHVLLQFLIEASVLSLVGGLIGIAAGAAAAKLMAARFGFTWIVRPAIVVVAVGVSAAVGIGFGAYPARKASRLDPIAALRFE